MDDKRSIEFWFTIASTYTYLTVMRLGEIEKSHNVGFIWKPFNRSAVGGSPPFPEGSSKTTYMWRDLERRAVMHGIPINVPAPFYPTRHRDLANKVAMVGMEEGWGPDFIRASYCRWFQLGQEMGGDPNLADSLREVGQDPDRIRKVANGERVGQLYQAQTDHARDRGLFGSPSFIVGNEIFWGDDRLEDAVSCYNHGKVMRD